MEYIIVFFSFLIMGHIYDEESRIRKLLLKSYAWKEVELLRILFYISRRSVMRFALFRKPFYYVFAHFLGMRGVVCQAATLNETLAFIDNLSDEHRIAVGPCRCRIGNKNCEHEIMTDIVIQASGEIWYRDLFPDDYRIISKEDAKDICRRSREAGMIQSIDRHMYFKNSENYFVICNCCKESCVPIIAYRVFKDEPYTFYPSRFVAEVDGNRCKACRTCIDACPFEERRLLEDGGHAAVMNCQGCGLCVDRCPEKASRMIPRSQSSLAHLQPW